MTEHAQLELIAAAVFGLGLLFNYLKSRQAEIVSRETKEAVDGVSHKADNLHTALNSELEKFKRETADQNARFLQAAIRLVRAEEQKNAAETLSQLKDVTAARILELERKLDVSEGVKQAAVATLAAAQTAADATLSTAKTAADATLTAAQDTANQKKGPP